MDKSKLSGKQTLVEEGTELKGTLKSNCQVVVNGMIDGQIEAPSLTVSQTGSVMGNVKAEKLRSEGTLAGSIDAEDVYLSGTVKSNTMIRANKLEVKLAQERGKLEVTFGECLLEVGEDPARAVDAKPEVVAAAPVKAEAPAMEASAPKENVDAEAKASDAMATSESKSEESNGRRNKKNSAENRHSQPPPAE